MGGPNFSFLFRKEGWEILPKKKIYIIKSVNKNVKKKSVNKRCPQNFAKKSVYQKFPLKVSTKSGRGVEGERKVSGIGGAGEQPGTTLTPPLCKVGCWC